MFTPLNMSCVTSCVMCHVSQYFFLFFGKSGEAYWGRVCYQRGLPRLVLWQIVDSDILKKNITTPQFARLERRAETRAEEAKVETKKQQNIAANGNMEAKKHALLMKKPHLRPKKPKIMLRKLNILLKKQRSCYWRPKGFWRTYS